MGMFDDIIIEKKELKCLTSDEIKILCKQLGTDDKPYVYFQTKSFDTNLYTLEILDGRLYQNDRGMKKFRSDVSIYNAEVYSYNYYDNKFIDCELNLHIKEGVVQEIKKKTFKIEDPPVYQSPIIIKKFGYSFLQFFYHVFHNIAELFRKTANKRRTIKY